MTATTALTAQNTLGVTDIHYTPPEFVRELIDACLSDIGVDVVKTGNFLAYPFRIFSSRNLEEMVKCLTSSGMLASAETIKVVAKALTDHHVTTTVIDPVCSSCACVGSISDKFR